MRALLFAVGLLPSTLSPKKTKEKKGRKKKKPPTASGRAVLGPPRPTRRARESGVRVEDEETALWNAIDSRVGELLGCDRSQRRRPGRERGGRTDNQNHAALAAAALVCIGSRRAAADHLRYTAAVEQPKNASWRWLARRPVRSRSRRPLRPGTRGPVRQQAARALGGGLDCRFAVQGLIGVLNDTGRARVASASGLVAWREIGANTAGTVGAGAQDSDSRVRHQGPLGCLARKNRREGRGAVARAGAQRTAGPVRHQRRSLGAKGDRGAVPARRRRATRCRQGRPRTAAWGAAPSATRARRRGLSAALKFTGVPVSPASVVGAVAAQSFGTGQPSGMNQRFTSRAVVLEPPGELVRYPLGPFGDSTI